MYFWKIRGFHLCFRLLFFLAITLSACSPPKLSSTASDLPTLRRGSGGEPESLDPSRSETNVAAHVLNDLFEGLVEIGPDNQVEPAVAESWDLTPDGKTYTFHFRPGLVWSNGDPLTAEDFVYSWRRALNPMLASEYAYLAYPIVNAREINEGKIKDPSALAAKAIDARTLQITLTAPTAYFVSLLAHNHFFPVHRASVEKWGSQFTKPGHLVSNGAFMLKEWTPQSRLVVVKNPRYHDAAKVKLGSVIFLSIESVNEEMNRFRAGEVDVTFQVPISQIPYIRKNFPAALSISPWFASEYYGFNVTKPPFKDNPKLRQALAMVIDRESLVKNIRHGVDTVAYGWVPYGLPKYQTQNVEWASWPMDKRIAEAKILYAEAGYGPDHPLNTSIIYNTQEDLRQNAVAIAAMWHKALGVNASITNEEFKVFIYTRQQKAATRVFRDGWFGDYLDPTTFSDMMITGNGQNNTGYSNPVYDDLMERGRNEVDAKKRAEILEQAERVLLADMPFIPLYYQSQIHLVAPYVRGFKPTICDYMYSKDMSIAPH